jgi:hypothetical protein
MMGPTQEHEGKAAGPRSARPRDASRHSRIDYVGAAFAPAPGTYGLLNTANTTRARLTTIQDSGRAGDLRGQMRLLHPLMAAAMYEMAFALEAGPLSTWAN